MKMDNSTNKGVKRLSRDFTKDILQDNAKKCIIPGKWILQSLLLWPDTKNKFITTVNWLCFINLIVVEIFHTAYVLLYRSDLGNAIIALATVTTTFEGIVRFNIIAFKKNILNDILFKIWKDFWPLTVVSTRKAKSLAFKCNISLALTLSCYGSAIFSNIMVTLWPHLMQEGLILKSIYPFHWNRTYVYEVIYTWQYFTQWYNLFLVNTFDFFVIPLMMVCAVQFEVLQSLYRNIFSDKRSQQRLSLFGEDLSDKEMIVKCLQQQKLLINICKQLEEMFRVAILFQFFNSIAALCSSCVILKVDASQFIKMLAFAVAHMFQLFYYCYVGSELTAQSSNVANAIYECNWHCLDGSKFRKDMILMIQRSQKRQTLTAVGIIDLDFLSYVKVLRISFSFYTLLNHLIDRKDSIE